jgi:hypothetical protein
VVRDIHGRKIRHCPLPQRPLSDHKSTEESRSASDFTASRFFDSQGHLVFRGATLLAGISRLAISSVNRQTQNHVGYRES